MNGASRAPDRPIAWISLCSSTEPPGRKGTQLSTQITWTRPPVLNVPAACRPPRMASLAARICFICADGCIVAPLCARVNTTHHGPPRRGGDESGGLEFGVRDHDAVWPPDGERLALLSEDADGRERRPGLVGRAGSRVTPAMAHSWGTAPGSQPRLGHITGAQPPAMAHHRGWLRPCLPRLCAITGVTREPARQNLPAGTRGTCGRCSPRS